LQKKLKKIKREKREGKKKKRKKIGQGFRVFTIIGKPKRGLVWVPHNRVAHFGLVWYPKEVAGCLHFGM